MKRKSLPVALTVAGSDSGGGAGVQADLKTFAALGVHGTTAVTCVTAQNPKGVLGVEACSPAMVRQQMEAVAAELRPKAMKTGMLYSKSIIQVVVNGLREFRGVPLVVDPVMVATSGGRLLKADAMKVLCEKLLPLARLITPNLDEAEVLVGNKLRSVEDMRLAARKLRERFGCAVLVKGGHLRGAKEAADVFYDGKIELLLTAKFIRGICTHGTGCTYSAAVTVYLARGFNLPDAVGRAKDYVTQAIAQTRGIGDHFALNHLMP